MTSMIRAVMRRSLAVSAATALLLLATAAPGFALLLNPTVRGDIRLAKTEFGSLSLSASNRLFIRTRFETASLLYRQGDICGAAGALQDVVSRSRLIRTGNPDAISQDLFFRTRLLRLNMLSTLPRRKTCANQGRALMKPKIGIIAANVQTFQATYRFGEARIWQVDEPQYPTFTQIEVPGIEFVGTPGLPGVPILQRLVAVPLEATGFDVTATPTTAETLNGVNLYPFQESALDASPVGFDPPFVIDAAAYATDAYFPLDGQGAPFIARVIPVGRVRDMQMIQVQVAAGRYNPVSDVLQLFSQVAVTVAFQLPSTKAAAAEPPSFLSSASLSPFESQATAVATSSVLNRAAALGSVGARPSFTVTGEELIILTHPDYLAAAETLADWKRAKGIITKVQVVSDGGGPGPDSNTAIDQWIEDEYDNSLIRPSYILLLGDAEDIPTFMGPPSNPWIPTDYQYALRGTADNLPDFAVGRIPVDTLDEANAVVAKIIAYEQNPPTSADFYRNATIASYFQCCRDGAPAGRDMRGFVETSELVRASMVAAGKTVQRIYNTDTGYNADYSGDSTPRYYYNGTPLPVPLGPPAVAPAGDTFWWGGLWEIVEAFNAGRFLIMHRDHGGSDGWGDPGGFGTEHLNWLANGNLTPVLFSVNCASGQFDGLEGFVEMLLRRPSGGVVGALGDTRNSPTWENNALTRGFYDALWPNTVSTYGSSSSIRRLGDILNYGKLYLMTQVGVGGSLPSAAAGEAENELYLWHCYGDPTLEVRINPPISLATAFSIKVLSTGLDVFYPLNGVEITAARESDGTPIGRGKVRDGVARLDFVGAFDPTEPLRLSVNRPDAKPLVLTDNLIIDEQNASLGTQALSCAPPLIPTRVLPYLSQSFVPDNASLAKVVLTLERGAAFPSGGYTTRIRIRDAAGSVVGTSSTKVPAGRATTVQVPFYFSPNLKLVPKAKYRIDWASPGESTLSLWFTARELLSDPYAKGTAYGCTGKPLFGDFLFQTWVPRPRIIIRP